MESFGDPGLVLVGCGVTDGQDGVADLERGPTAEVHQQEEGVEAPRQGLHGVEVGRQPRRRLRGTLCDEAADFEAVHWVGVALRSVGCHQVGRLGEDVKGVVVTWDRQRSVAFWIPGEQPLGVGRTSVRTDTLGGDRGNGVPALEEFRAVPTPEVLVSGRHVVPEHDHRAVEVGRVRGPHHHEAGLVRCGLHRLDLPSPVPAGSRPGAGAYRAASPSTKYSSSR